MQLRRKSLTLIACGLTAVIAVPAFASSPAAPTATIEAHDSPAKNWFQDASQGSDADSSVTIKAGEQVRFAYPAGSSVHNVQFQGAQPTDCVQTAGVAIDPDRTAPLPNFSQPPGWDGSCTFSEPGTYTFFCQAHPPTQNSPGMTGTVIVEKAPDVPTPTATPVETVVPQATASPQPTPAATPAPTPAPSAALNAPSKPKVATFAKSGLKLTGPCASISSGKVTLSVTKAVAKKLKLKGTTLGTGTGKCTAGTFSVTVKPSAAVKKALKKHKGSVAATATLKAGTVTATRKVTLK
ncbi:copper binding plastocyanin/azurin family protein [Solirubrobacter pauli]|uniref:Copper binding plastocyanin/azurin family protein n=1 Tax=Solirubrobacter pauli TaxID=166793 RepID=A0A660L4M1_9ACTN|nr:plastocyanin/azurin family copper-binding protein [Solirubrobacter pauli]RKQ88154.1 copper binding plastocyanin/azurin family protein [Solirubrobacter pauli]